MFSFRPNSVRTGEKYIFSYPRSNYSTPYLYDKTTQQRKQVNKHIPRNRTMNSFSPEASVVFTSSTRMSRSHSIPESNTSVLFDIQYTIIQDNGVCVKGKWGRGGGGGGDYSFHHFQFFSKITVEVLAVCSVSGRKWIVCGTY